MKISNRWTSALTGAAMVIGLSAAVLAAAGPASATTPGFEPDPNASNGSIVFYDASGNVITSGTDLSHLFEYAEASTPTNRSGTINKATAVFAFPDHTKPDSTTWTKANATASTPFPNASAPAPLNTSANPVASATSTGDANLSALLSTTTLDTTPGYANIVEIQLKDSGPGNPAQLKPFWRTDIMFDKTAGTWQQVYPATAQATTTTLGAAPTGGAAVGATVTLTATVTPNTAAGTVQFMDGTTDINSAVSVSGGTAQTTTTTLAAGSHSLTAVFTPTDTTAYSGSTSAAVPYVIANVPDAPTGASAVAHGGSATVSWTAPAMDGGSAITGYDVQYSSDNGTTWTSGSSAFHTSTATMQTVTGLTNGTSYVFRAAAINVIGTGAYSAPSTAVIPSADATSLTIGRSTTIAAGKSVSISTTLKDTTANSAIGGASVTLLSRAPGGVFHNVRSVTTNGSGAASVAVSPQAKTDYKWSYSGTPQHAAATSGIETVSVSQVVSASAPARARKRASFSVYGTVAPGLSGLTESLQVKIGNRFKTIATVKTKRQKLPNGRTVIGFVFSVKENKAGNYTFQVVSSATAVLLSGTSHTLGVRIA